MDPVYDEGSRKRSSTAGCATCGNPWQEDSRTIRTEKSASASANEKYEFESTTSDNESESPRGKKHAEPHSVRIRRMQALRINRSKKQSRSAYSKRYRKTRLPWHLWKNQ